MESTTRLILPEVREALRTDPRSLLELLDELLPADLADLAGELEPELAHKLLEVLPVDVTARLLENAAEETRADLFAALAKQDVGSATAVTDEMAADDRADLYAELPDPLRTRLLTALDPEESRDIRLLLAYPEGSAGALMTTDFVALPSTATVAEAIEHVRATAEAMETIYSAYAVDSNGTLLGVVSLRDLVTSPLHKTIDNVMNPNIITAAADEDQEEVARLMGKYDLLALPIVDRTHHMLGIVTVDDVMDVVEEEATEDVHRLGAIEPIEQPFMGTPIRTFVRARAPWLIALFLAGTINITVLAHYSNVPIRHLGILMWFVPLIISSGGNAGSQSATLVIRAMAVGDIAPRNALKVLGRELAVAGVLGGLLGAVGFSRVMLFDTTRSLVFGGAIALAVGCVVMFGSLLGAAVPLVLERLKIDPAVSSTPFIASIVDIAGLVIFFEIARHLLL
jgi:magnesium transporter